MAQQYAPHVNAVPDINGVSWNRKYTVADAQSQYFKCVEVLGSEGNEIVRGIWDSSTVFSSAAKAACIYFPKGSQIIDVQAKVIWIKIAASGTDTWAYSATLT